MTDGVEGTGGTCELGKGNFSSSFRIDILTCQCNTAVEQTIFLILIILFCESPWECIILQNDVFKTTSEPQYYRQHFSCMEWIPIFIIEMTK